MKHLKRVFATIMAIALAFSISSGFSGENVMAKSNKKTLKISSVSHKISMRRGNKKTIKVSKKKKGYSVKSSNAKVVKVIKKDKKIVLKALKKGSSKITVKYKGKNQKKYLFKVTVKKKKAKFSVKVKKNSTFVLKCKKPTKLKAGMIKVIRKKTKKKKSKKVKVTSLTKENSTTYVVDTNYAFDKGEVARFKTTNTDSNDYVDTKMPLKRIQKHDRHVEQCNVGEKFDEEILVGTFPKEILSVSDVPEGFKKIITKDNSIRLKGTFSKAGIYTVTGKTRNFDNSIEIFDIVFVVGSPNEIAVLSNKNTFYGYNKEWDSNRDENLLDLRIQGGSGKYKCELISGDKAFKVTNDPIGSYIPIVELQTCIPGEYPCVLKITDCLNEDISTIVKCPIIIKNTIKITGRIKTETGKNMAGAYIWISDNDYDYTTGATTDENGQYTAYVRPGNYAIEASIGGRFIDETVGYIDKPCKFDFDAKGWYEIKIVSNPLVYFRYWFNSEDVSVPHGEDEVEAVGFGNTIYMKKGKHSIEGSAYLDEENQTYAYDAKLIFKVKGDMTVTAQKK